MPVDNLPIQLFMRVTPAVAGRLPLVAATASNLLRARFRFHLSICSASASDAAISKRQSVEQSGGVSHKAITLCHDSGPPLPALSRSSTLQRVSCFSRPWQVQAVDAVGVEEVGSETVGLVGGAGAGGNGETGVEVVIPCCSGSCGSGPRASPRAAVLHAVVARVACILGARGREQLTAKGLEGADAVLTQQGDHGWKPLVARLIVGQELLQVVLKCGLLVFVHRSAMRGSAWLCNTADKSPSSRALPRVECGHIKALFYLYKTSTDVSNDLDWFDSV
eukprot:90441-Prorocentrum_minimum.AAC.2